MAAYGVMYHEKSWRRVINQRRLLCRLMAWHNILHRKHRARARKLASAKAWRSIGIVSAAAAAAKAWRRRRKRKRALAHLIENNENEERHGSM